MPQQRNVSEDELKEKESNLNHVQRNIYDSVVMAIERQRQHWNESKPIPRCHCDDCPQVLKFISGVGGTGKSFLIDVLADKVSSVYHTENGPSVVICAPTGIAAFQIKGTTLHRLLRLKVQHGKTPMYEELTRDKLKELRTMLEYVRLIIIDEISMVSHLQLAFIHRRLHEIFGDPRQDILPFGNINIVVFGDLLQLPPVNEKPVFSKITSTDAKKSSLGISTQNLWNFFHYDELTINMRHKDDKENYAEMLNRIRLGSPSNSDITILNKHRMFADRRASKKEVAEKLQQLQQMESDKKNIICIMPLNESVDELNQEMLKINNIDTVEIAAEDSTMRQLSRKKKGKTVLKKKKTSDTAGLETVLKIGVNARVMLRRNIDVDMGLCNGVMGIVTELKRPKGKISEMMVHFDHMKQPYGIQIVKADYEISANIFVTRTQFPLCVAYAITIHKSQGISVDGVIVDLGPNVFSNGMAYVALSRARKLCNVFLIDFEPSKLLKCDQSAWMEYNRLRASTNREDLPPLPKCCTRPPIIETVQKRSKQTRKRALDVEIEMSYIKKKAVLPTKAKTVQTHLYLINDRNACFANCIVQMMRQMVIFVETIDKHDNAIEREIKTLMSPGKKNVSRLRQLIGGIYNDGNEQSSDEFWNEILNRCSDHVKSIFQYEHLLKTRCIRLHDANCSTLLHNDECNCQSSSGCGTESDEINELQAFLILYPQDGRQQFKNLLKTETTLSKMCDRCNRNTEHSEVLRKVYPNEMRYLIMLINRLHMVHGEMQILNSEIMNFSANKQNIFGKNFKVIAATMHTLDSAHCGHFTCIVRNGEKWDVISDETLVKQSVAFPSKMKDIVLLCMERLD